VCKESRRQHPSRSCGADQLPVARPIDRPWATRVGKPVDCRNDGAHTRDSLVDGKSISDVFSHLDSSGLQVPGAGRIARQDTHVEPAVDQVARDERAQPASSAGDKDHR